MWTEQTFNDRSQDRLNFSNVNINVSRRAVIGIILVIALFSFEIFNFDTTRYALNNLLGDVRFAGLQWAGILAIAFCAIDFAGLAQLFTPEKGREEPKEVWYLMGAWLLGATMNAVMTWWAVSLTLLNHGFGNEVLSRDTLLSVVPIFVAALVWLTRILFIGAFTVAGDRLFDFSREAQTVASVRPAHAAALPTTQPLRAPKREPVQRVPRAHVPVMADASDEMPDFLATRQQAPAQPEPTVTRVTPSRKNNSTVRHPHRQQNSRIRQRPPMPRGISRTPVPGIQARSRNRH